jgi:DNA-binding Xre family transcriptional regulator
VKRDVDYQWRLAEVMARNGMHTSTVLAPLLRERGIDLSPSQVYRLVTQRPERVSLRLLAAVCDIFDCGPEEFVTVTAADANQQRKAAAAGKSKVTKITDAIKPVRARITDDP